jgi:glycyl-tRNA synthetase
MQKSGEAWAMALNFQDVIMKLNAFWAEQGCVVWQPYNIQVGAGTGNPATLLRVLGPEPWRVAYVEPSVRPDDGRYGENPNRMQYYFQYQVILKPDPGNPQEIYLESLKAIGIDPRQHDIRFVEDNWESPALGAWGLGWEVWMDGQEITQFTYFQQAGGLNLDPVSVEITYGLERIVLALQGKNAAWEINYTDAISYGDMFFRSEVEHCIYYFEVADVEGLRQTFEVYQKEHQRALERGLLVPAYDYVLKCSHLFNVLDTRGAIGVTERAAYFRRMRGMTLNIAKAFAKQREEMSHPLNKLNSVWDVPYTPLTPGDLSQPTAAADFILEIGTEELPADDVTTAYKHLQAAAPDFFDKLRLSHEGLQVYATPRRLVILAHKLAARQADEVEEVKGPAVAVGVDVAGNYTKAAEGFARKNGVPVENLGRKQIDNTEYLVAQVERKGQGVVQVLAEALPGLIAGIKFPKTMRWHSGGVAFSRPIRWLVALFGQTLVPFEYAHAQSGARTRGVRPLGSPELAVKDAASYLQAIESQGIVLDMAARRASIEAQIEALAKEVGGKVPADSNLLDEVTNLVEEPTALRGDFNRDFLKLPREVLITVMRKHQRYFAIEDEAGQLLPHFIAVRNGDAEFLELVKHGNEHVLVARFTDAQFFYTADIQHRLEDYLPRLSTLTFQEKLGSMLDKNHRVAGLVRPFGEMLGAADDLLDLAERAAQLAKADLAAQMVVEMTSLQGTMGRIYAQMQGEDQAVANAIYEHWLPRGAGDDLPASAAGVLLALLDRLDSLAGLFAVGLEPSAASDPFALRRAALGVVQILLDRDLSLDLRGALALIGRAQAVEVSYEHQKAVLNFIAARLESLLLEEGQPNDIVKAVLAEQGHNPARALAGIVQLKEWVKREDWFNILDSYARCVRITRNVGEVHPVNPEHLQHPSEQALYEAYQGLRGRLPQDYNIGDFLAAFAPLVPIISQFFEQVMVMDEDLNIRHNRLGLLQAIGGLTDGRADLSQLVGF